jgi:hypothetical protein
VPPDSPHYRLVYDLAQAGYTGWPYPGIAVALLVVSVANAKLRRRRRQPLGPWGDRSTAAFLGCVAILLFAVTYLPYRSMRKALESGRFTVVEGTVQRYRLNDPVTTDEETWEVVSGGSVYRYSYDNATPEPGFGHTTAHGGPIHEGLRVRIADVGGSIARLEVAP